MIMNLHRLVEREDTKDNIDASQKTEFSTTIRAQFLTSTYL